MFSGNTFFKWKPKKKSPGSTFPINYDDIFHYLIKLLTAAFQKQALEVILHKIQDCQQESVGFFVSRMKLLRNLGYSNGKKRCMQGCQKHPRDLNSAEQTLILCLWPILLPIVPEDDLRTYKRPTQQIKQYKHISRIMKRCLATIWKDVIYF